AEPVATGHHRRRRDRIPFAGSHPQKASQPEYPSHRQQSRLQLLPPPVPFRHLPGYHPHPLVPELKSPYKTPHALPAPSPRWGRPTPAPPPTSTAPPQPQRFPSLLPSPATRPRRGGPPHRPPSEIDRPTVAPASHSFLYSSLLLSSPLFPDQSDGGSMPEGSTVRGADALRAIRRRGRRQAAGPSAPSRRRDPFPAASLREGAQPTHPLAPPRGPPTHRVHCRRPRGRRPGARPHPRPPHTHARTH